MRGLKLPGGGFVRHLIKQHQLEVDPAGRFLEVNLRSPENTGGIQFLLGRDRPECGISPEISLSLLGQPLSRIRMSCTHIIDAILVMWIPHTP